VSQADVGLAIAAGLGAAAAFGLGSAVQHDQAAQVARRRSSVDPRLLTSLVQRPVWLLGISADMVAIALQAVGLRFGPVVLVQPLLVGALPVAVVLSALLERRRTTRRETAGLLLCTGGLALVVPASASVNLGRHTGARAWVIASVVLIAAVALLLLAARRQESLAPVATGMAAGVAAGAGSILLAVCAKQFDDPVGLLHTPAPYAAALVGLLGLLLTQAAFQTGAIAAPLAALAVSEPIVAVVLALTVLHERLPGSLAARAAGSSGALIAAAGVLTLASARRDAAAREAVAV
jgi:drug/metabolite transporter (DMT)-like permease